MQENMKDSELCLDLLKACDKFLETAKVDKGHGIDHIIAVLNHVDNALNVMSEKIDPVHTLAIRIAAILHDVDDHKFFNSSIEGLNEKFLLSMFEKRIEKFIQDQEISLLTYHDGCIGINGIKDETIKRPQNYSEFEVLVKKMIDLVSCSSNGNSNESDYPQWMLYPRIADRLEAIGEIGIVRALQYGEYRNRPMYDDETERAYTIEELRDIACPERFRRYLGGTRNCTTIGHFYDKILHIGKSKDFGVNNEYFNKVAEIRHKEVEDWVLRFWHSLPAPSSPAPIPTPTPTSAPTLIK